MPAHPEFEYAAITERLHKLAGQYQAAQAFPHIAIDDLFPADLLHQVVGEFPAPEAMSIRFDSEREKKSAESNWSMLGPATRSLITGMNSGAFLSALTELTGIPRLIADEQLEGSGLHQISSGGLLDIHADFSNHSTGLHRRLNALLYLNEGWDPAWGGHLELWDPTMTRLVEAIEPQFNRLVVFTTSSDSFHGHPTPLATPPGVMRRSVAAYYYTVSREVPTDPHSTRWGRPESRLAGEV